MDTNTILTIPTLEDEECEFKLKLEGQKEKIEKWAKTIVGFANTHGGHMLVGIDNDLNRVGLSKKEIDETKNLVLTTINRYIFPHIDVSFSLIEADREKNILDIYVPFSSEIVFYKLGDYNETVYIRKNGASIPASVKEIVAMGKRKFGIDNHLRNEQFEKKDYGKYLALGKKYRKDKSEPTYELLVSKEAIGQDGRVSEGLKMFSDSYSSDDTLISCRSWRGYDKGDDEVLDKKEYSGSISAIFPETMNFIYRNSRSGFIKMSDGSRLDTLSYPEQALREAIINAIAHRDYSFSGSQIGIDIFKDRLEIVSPGSWMLSGKPSDYDMDKIPSVRRNKIICNCFEAIGLMEKIGSGFKKISSIYERLHAKKPRLESNNDFFIITLYDLLADGSDLESTITYTKYDQAILSFCENEARSREEIQKHISYSSRSHFLIDVLNPLLQAGLLLKTSNENSRNVKYIAAKR